MSLRDLYYSPLCDVDRKAYLAFLAAVARDGSGVGRDGVSRWVGGDARCDRCGTDFGECFSDAVSVVEPQLGEERALIDGGSGANVGLDDSLHMRAVGEERREVVIGGVSGGDVGDGSGDVCGRSGDVGVQASFGCNADAAVGRPQAESGDDVGSLSVVRGKHYERNARRRRLRKEKRGQNSICSNEPVGYFSGCDAEVRSELRDTRARMLIENNKLGAQMARSRSEKARLEQESRVGEAKFELSRQRVEEQLRQLNERLLSAVGSAASSAGGSYTECSVSPKSSISVVELERVMSRVRELENREKVLKFELERSRLSSCEAAVVQKDYDVMYDGVVEDVDRHERDLLTRVLDFECGIGS